jgi:hypothetical protein
MSTWEKVEDVDMKKRTPEEWAEIYHIKLLGDITHQLWSEYEWAYHFPTLNYQPLPDDQGEFMKFSEMELRAHELRRDLIKTADNGERYVLQEEERYIETDWVKRRLKLI